MVAWSCCRTANHHLHAIIMAMGIMNSIMPDILSLATLIIAAYIYRFAIFEIHVTVPVKSPTFGSLGFILAS